jgi:hypothetical protein
MFRRIVFDDPGTQKACRRGIGLNRPGRGSVDNLIRHAA